MNGPKGHYPISNIRRIIIQRPIPDVPDIKSMSYPYLESVWNFDKFKNFKSKISYHTYTVGNSKIKYLQSDFLKAKGSTQFSTGCPKVECAF